MACSQRTGGIGDWQGEQLARRARSPARTLNWASHRAHLEIVISCTGGPDLQVGASIPTTNIVFTKNLASESPAAAHSNGASEALLIMTSGSKSPPRDRGSDRSSR